MPPAARITDMHTCPMQDPTPVGPKPHVGLPAACVGDAATCAGPPDAIVKGSMTVLIGNRPAARMGDSMAHGGTIVAGFPTVMIGG